MAQGNRTQKINMASISPEFRLKRMNYDTNMFDNSEEFKNLGTMHYEKRMIDYYPVDDAPVAGIRTGG